MNSIPALFAAAVLATGSTARAAEDREARAVEATLHAICAAFRDGDTATLERLLDPRFTLIASDAVLTDRAQEIESLRGGHADYDEFRNHGMTTRLHGDVAVVTGITSVAGRWDGKPFARELRFTDTLQRRDGAWVLLASHATPIPAP